jgi:multicomponent Na+:H+ antiporter subunit D
VLALPLAIPWTLAIIMALLDGRKSWIGWIAVLGLAANLAVFIWIALTVAQTGTILVVAGGWPSQIGITLRADPLGVLFGMLSNGVLLAALLYQVLVGVKARIFPSLVLFISAGLSGLFLTGDVFNFYVFFEISMISAFVITSYGEHARQMRATLIFVTVNLIGSVLFLGAVAAIYHTTGTLDMREVAVRLEAVHPSSVALIGAILLAAFGLKIGLFPFHSWLPPVYRDSRPAVAAILSGALANIGSYGLLRFGGEIVSGALQMGTPILLLLGTASIVYGAVLAISRFPTSEVLAYSSIGQAGYILIALAIGGPVGLAAAVLYAVINAMNKTLLFLSAGLSGWLVGGAFAIGALSVAGIPPAAGFFGKAAVFRAGVEQGSFTLVGLVFLGGALSLVYMFQIYQRDFWARDSWPGVSPLPARGLVLLLAGLVIGLGLWPEPLLASSSSAAEALLGGLR